MGARPAAALALATLPHASEAIQEEDLYQLLAGAAAALAAEGCALAGGHTCEGAELALGFAVTGHAPEGALLRKSGLRPGDALVLTKPLGTGAVMAAAMRGAAEGRWVAAALDAMQQSSGAAARVLARHGARAATDVTGFGLLGHAAEMARASSASSSSSSAAAAAAAAAASHGAGAVVLEIDPARVPSLPGAADCVAAGHLSSLHAANARALAAVEAGSARDWAARDARWPLLVDPQTAGGLLAGVPAGAAEACVAELRAAGYAGAAVIGRVLEAAAVPVAGGDAADGGGGDDGGRQVLITTAPSGPQPQG